MYEERVESIFVSERYGSFCTGPYCILAPDVPSYQWLFYCPTDSGCGPMGPHPASPHQLRLEEPDDLALFVDVHVVGGRFRGETRHRHHGAGQCHNEARTGSDIEFADGDAEPVRGTEGFRI